MDKHLWDKNLKRKSINPTPYGRVFLCSEVADLLSSAILFGRVLQIKIRDTEVLIPNKVYFFL
jgi:hypothetical protein